MEESTLFQPFDKRLMVEVSSAVASSAVETRLLLKLKSLI